jgi:hypothetical protein
MGSRGDGSVRAWAAILVIATFFLNGCENNLLFMERTGFNLSIRVNNDPTTPVEVNAGLKRSVVAAVPPTGDPVKTENGTRANGEAVSLISGYDLSYDESKSSLFAGTLTIRTQFASGGAATAVAGDPTVVAMIADTSGTFSFDDAAKKLRAFWKPDGKTIDSGNQKKISDWMQRYGLRTETGDITMFLYNDSPLDQQARGQAVKDLKL